MEGATGFAKPLEARDFTDCWCGRRPWFNPPGPFVETEERSDPLGQTTDGGRGPLKIVRHTASDRSFSKTHFLFLPMIGRD